MRFEMEDGKPKIREELLRRATSTSGVSNSTRAAKITSKLSLRPAASFVTSSRQRSDSGIMNAALTIVSCQEEKTSYHQTIGEQAIRASGAVDQHSSSGQMIECEESNKLNAIRGAIKSSNNKDQNNKGTCSYARCHPLAMELKRIRESASSSSGPGMFRTKGKDLSSNSDRMAATLKLIGSTSGARSLRQINIVGQLNHSARRGMLMVMMNLVLTFATLLCLLQGSAHAGLWPFGSSSMLSRSNSSSEAGSSVAPSVASSLWQSLASSRGSSKAAFVGGASTASSEAAAGPRLARHTGAMGGPSPMPGAPQPPITQQFHYFWNHDQIDQKTMADEAQRVLAEAQLQTDRMVFDNASSLAPPSMGSNSRVDLPTSVGLAQAVQQQDSLVSAASNPFASALPAPGPQVSSQQQEPVSMIPPAIQQQLTGLVLQLQRQQQLSMMMQPKFNQAALEAQRRLSGAGAVVAPLLGRGFSWPGASLSMAASSQQPIIAVPPPPSLTASSMAAQESLIHQSQMQPRASVAGVPVYGPFMVAPRPPPMNFQAATAVAAQAAAAAAAAAQMQFNQHAHLAAAAASQRRAPLSGKTSSSVTANSRSSFASSLLRGRKSPWPFSTLSSLGSGVRGEHHLASGSHPRPTVVPPPPGQQGTSPAAEPSISETARVLASSLPPESLALIDMTSNQLANAIMNQMQMRSAQQRLVAAMASAASTSNLAGLQAGDPLDTASSSASMTSVRSAAGASGPEQTFSLTEVAPIASQQQTPSGKIHLQPPYLLNAGAGKHRQQQQLMADSLLLYGEQPSTASQNFDLGQARPPSNASFMFGWPASNNNNNQSFGFRLKRRQLYPVSSSRPIPSIFQLQAPGTERLEFATERLGDGARAAASANDSQIRAAKVDSAKVSQAREIHAEAAVGAGALDQLTSDSEAHDDSTSAPKSLRRLKRSFPEIKQGNRTSRSLKSSTFSSSSGGWKSIENANQHQKVSPDGWVTPVRSGHKTSPPTTSATVNHLAAPSSVSPSSVSAVGATQPIAAKSPSAWTVSSWRQSASTSTFEPSKTDTASVEADARLNALVTASPMLRRQAEMVPGKQEIISQKESSQLSAITATASTAAPVSAHNHQNSDQQTAESSQQPRQERALKMKRITSGSASKSATESSVPNSPAAMHSPFAESTAKRQALTRAAGAMRHSVAPTHNDNQQAAAKEPQQQSQQQKSASGTQEASAQQRQAADPMNASLSESARVVNYFASVDNEQPTVTSSVPPSTTTTTRPQEAPSGHPQMNVGYPAPAKAQSQIQQQQFSSVVVGRLNGTANQSGNGHLQQQQLTYSGSSGGSASLATGSSGLQDFLAGAGVGGTSGDQLGAPQQQQQQSQQLHHLQQFKAQQSVAPAHNADISSAATGHQAYAVQNSVGGVISGGPSANLMPSGVPLPRQQFSNHQMMQIPAQPQHLHTINRQIPMATASSRFNSESSSPFAVIQGANLLNTLLGLDPTKRSSNPSTTIMTTAGSQLQPRKQLSSNPNLRGNYYNHNMDRAPSADQSNSYNEEVLLPLGASSQTMMTNEQLQMLELQQQQQDAQTANGLPPGFSDNSFGTRNQQQQGSIDNSFVDQSVPQVIELNRYNQQQQQQQASQLAQQQLFASSFNGTLGADTPQQFVSPPPAPVDTSSILDSSSLYSQSAGQQQQQSDVQLLAASQNQQLSGGAGVNPLTLRPQSANWQQLQSLDNAVNNFNTQIQQLEDLQRQSIAAANIGQPSMGQQQQRQQQQQQPMVGGQFYSSSSSFDTPGASTMTNLYGAGSSPQALGGLPVDEDAAANAAAAAGIPTYPSAAQLLALQAAQQHQQHGGLQLAPNVDLSSMLMASSENRESEAESGKSSGKKKGKKGGKGVANGKHVSHHYHFNSLASPLEDPDSQFNQLDFAGALAAQEQARANKAALAKKEEEEQKQQEENEESEKPKKKGGFLRRFSLKNLFKRFRKEKKNEESPDQVEEQQNDSPAGSGGTPVETRK